MEGGTAVTRTLWSGAALALLIAVGVGSATPALLACEEGDPVELASRVKDRYQDAILAVPGVVGVGVGRASATGDVVIRVYVAGQIEQIRQQLPAELEGIPVQIVESGQFTPR